jgi:hypothetical protein
MLYIQLPQIYFNVLYRHWDPADTTSGSDIRGQQLSSARENPWSYHSQGTSQEEQHTTKWPTGKTIAMTVVVFLAKNFILPLFCKMGQTATLS